MVVGGPIGAVVGGVAGNLVGGKFSITRWGLSNLQKHAFLIFSVDKIELSLG